MATRRRAIAAQAFLVIGVVIPLGCSTFGEDAASDAGTDASIDQKEQRPDGSVPELCIGAACGPICGPGETRSTYPVNRLTEELPPVGGNCTTFPAGGAPATLLGDKNEGSDQGLTEIRCSMPQTLVFAHAPFDVMTAPYRLVVRAWALHEGAEPSADRGIVLGAVKGLSTVGGAPIDKSPVRPTGGGWGIVSYVVDHVPGSSTPFSTKTDGDDVTILLDIRPAAGGTIHVSRAWLEVCRQKQ